MTSTEHFLIVGIDPGVNGAVTVLRHDGEILGIRDMPTEQRGTKRAVSAIQLCHILKDAQGLGAIARVTLEQVHSRPKEGVSSAFGFGESYGLVKGIAAGLGLPVYLVTPPTWKKAFKLTGQPKDQSRTVAQSLWPSCRDLSRKKDVDRADALLIAEYGRRAHLGMR